MSLFQTIRKTIARLTGALIGGSAPAMVIDLSHWQWTIDPEMWGHWIQFALVKASENLGRDARFAYLSGVLLDFYAKIGVYHYLRPWSTGQAQADVFWGIVGELARAGKISVLMVDVEAAGLSLEIVRAFFNRLRSLVPPDLGIEIQCYTRKTYVDTVPGLGDWLRAEQIPLMVAHYLTLEPVEMSWEEAYAFLKKSRFVPWVPSGCQAVIHQITGDRIACPGVWDDQGKLSRLDLSFAAPGDAARWAGEIVEAPHPVYRNWLPMIFR